MNSDRKGFEPLQQKMLAPFQVECFQPDSAIYPQRTHSVRLK